MMRYILLAAVSTAWIATFATAQTDTTFTYQAELTDGGEPASGLFNMDFSLWDAVSGGNLVGGFIMIDNVPVNEGRFAVELDFGANAFDGSLRFLEIEVQGVTLSPRQPLNPVPYAIQTRGIFVDDAGRVGIGTTSPASALDVIGQRVRFENTAGTRQLDFRTNGGAVDIQSLTSNIFIHASGGADNNHIVMQPFGGEGNVGIGTPAPVAKLHVQSGSDVSPAGGGIIQLGSSLSENLAIDSNEIMARLNGGVAALHLNAEGGDIVLGQQGSGHVGIGTADPPVKLTVEGGTDASESGGGFLQLGAETSSNLALDNNEIQSRFDGGSSTMSINKDGGPILLNEQGLGFVGIGLGAGVSPATPFQVRANFGNPGTPFGHVVLFESVAPGNPAILALKAVSVDNPDATSHYITFFDSQNQEMGAITGHEVLGVPIPGVRYTSASGDFAERLPVVNPDELIEAGDAVGIVDGAITRTTTGAQSVMVVSTAPAFVGNDYAATSGDDHRMVAFMGQVPVKVRGPVDAGDLLIASGAGDGTAVAVAPRAVQVRDLNLVVGTAWETNHSEGVKLIIAAVGIDQAAVLRAIVQRQDRLIGELVSRIERLEENLR